MKQMLVLAVAALLASGTVYAAENSQQNKMKTCQAEAGDKKLEGQARQDYVNNCLKAKPAKSTSKNKMAMCNEKTKGMSKADADKARSECMKAS
ncbi:MAG TPA: PsiF family protein [Casimicrobiaceae bacterium]|nr:PsiF family protein [Casimicrobiaceae bacterium]